MSDAYHKIEPEKSNILKEAVTTAVLGGWSPPFEEPITDVYLCQDDVGVDNIVQIEPYVVIVFDNETSDLLIGVPGLLYDHAFARALWGENDCMQNGDDRLFGAPMWKYHLQEMVIADDPITYLGGTLK